MYFCLQSDVGGASRLQELVQNLSADVSDRRVEFGYSPAGTLVTDNPSESVHVCGLEIENRLA